jgi:hypothetical protein
VRHFGKCLPVQLTLSSSHFLVYRQVMFICTSHPGDQKACYGKQWWLWCSGWQDASMLAGREVFGVGEMKLFTFWWWLNHLTPLPWEDVREGKLNASVGTERKVWGGGEEIMCFSWFRETSWYGSLSRSRLPPPVHHSLCLHDAIRKASSVYKAYRRLLYPSDLSATECRLLVRAAFWGSLAWNIGVCHWKSFLCGTMVVLPVPAQGS